MCAHCNLPNGTSKKGLRCKLASVTTEYAIRIPTASDQGCSASALLHWENVNPRPQAQLYIPPLPPHLASIPAHPQGGERAAALCGKHCGAALSSRPSKRGPPPPATFAERSPARCAGFNQAPARCERRRDGDIVDDDT